jgi:hypothetical protein
MASTASTRWRVRRGRGFRRRPATSAAATATMLLSSSNAWNEDERDQHKQQVNESSIQLGHFTASWSCKSLFSPHRY